MGKTQLSVVWLGQTRVYVECYVHFWSLYFHRSIDEPEQCRSGHWGGEKWQLSSDICRSAIRKEDYTWLYIVQKKSNRPKGS